jgi:hypothetical protein
MWEYFCKKCNKMCDKDEVELREDQFEGDWEDFHIDCGTKVQVILKMD